MVHLREVQRGRDKGARQCPFSKKDFGLRAPEDALSASALPTGHMLQSILPEGCLRKHFEIAAVPSGRPAGAAPGAWAECFHSDRNHIDRFRAVVQRPPFPGGVPLLSKYSWIPSKVERTPCSRSLSAGLSACSGAYKGRKSPKVPAPAALPVVSLHRNRAPAVWTIHTVLLFLIAVVSSGLPSIAGRCKGVHVLFIFPRRAHRVPEVSTNQTNSTLCTLNTEKPHI